MTRPGKRRARLRRLVKAAPKVYRFLRTPRESLPPLEKGQVRRFRTPRTAASPEVRLRPDALTAPKRPKPPKAPKRPKRPKKPRR